ncbi:MAG: hut operon positive regulator HutP [Clostridiales bacterium]|nr:hut operon positive regulator HutP [Clostridiales bacterium]
MQEKKSGSREVAKGAILLAMTESREEEQKLKLQLVEEGIQGVAVDYGGDFLSSIMKLVERAVVAAKREKIILDTHHEEGAVAGAAREAISQITSKALGLSVGGKIAVARKGEHVSVAVFFGIGLVHLNEICIGMGHRAI